MNKCNILKECCCKSILLVESEDISIDILVNKSKLEYYFSYYCPICYKKNYLLEKELPIYLIKEKLVKIRNSLC